MFYGVVVVGAWTLHELVKVARRVLLGLCARMISHGEQSVGGDSSCSFSPLSGGALVLILALGLSFVVASVEARWERRLLEVLDKDTWS